MHDPREGRGRGRGSGANPGRIAAVRALIDVEEGAHLEDVLPQYAPSFPADRSLAWNLAFGVLRHRGQIDAALRGCLKQPIDALEAPVRCVLRVGAYERLLGRAKAYAVVDQGVEVARAVRAGRASGLVNAVLRRVEPAASPSRAEQLNHPAWLVSRWDDRYGEAATTAWCQANGEPPPISVAIKGDVASQIAAFRAQGLEPTPARAAGEEVPNVWTLGDSLGRIEELPGFEEGDWWIQDAASAWMTDLVPASAKEVLDACAAPGGKSFRLAARGHAVTSVDVSMPRLDAMGESLHRLGLSVARRKHDWMEGPIPGVGAFDAVLVDAPCTALGTVRRHPEIRWRRAPLDPMHAAARQKRILAEAATHVRPTGVLVYVVCSPEPEEGQQVVDAFLKAHPTFRLDETRCSAPPQHGEDAFFGVRMVRG